MFLCKSRKIKSRTLLLVLLWNDLQNWILATKRYESGLITLETYLSLTIEIYWLVHKRLAESSSAESVSLAEFAFLRFTNQSYGVLSLYLIAFDGIVMVKWNNYNFLERFYFLACYICFLYFAVRDSKTGGSSRDVERPVATASGITHHAEIHKATSKTSVFTASTKVSFLMPVIYICVV